MTPRIRTVRLSVLIQVLGREVIKDGISWSGEEATCTHTQGVLEPLGEMLKDAWLLENVRVYLGL